MELFRQVFEIYQEIGKRIRKVRDGHKTNYRSNNSKNLNPIPTCMASLIAAGEKGRDENKSQGGDYTAQTGGGYSSTSHDVLPSNQKN